MTTLRKRLETAAQQTAAPGGGHGRSATLTLDNYKTKLTKDFQVIYKAASNALPGQPWIASMEDEIVAPRVADVTKARKALEKAGFKFTQDDEASHSDDHIGYRATLKGVNVRFDFLTSQNRKELLFIQAIGA